MLPTNIASWISANAFPQRVLFSGDDSALPIAINAAAQLQKSDVAKIESGIHPDTMVFRDNGKSFKVNYSEAAKKDDQREEENAQNLIRWAYQKPMDGNHRIAIIENIERASISASNALLKLLEEPPRYAIFLLTTKNHHQLLDTIISRVTIVRLASEAGAHIDHEHAQAFLQNQDQIAQFQIIEALDKMSRDNKDKKIDRTIFKTFLLALMNLCRENSALQSRLELLWETHQAIDQNVNPKLALERMVVRGG